LTSPAVGVEELGWHPRFGVMGVDHGERCSELQGYDLRNTRGDRRRADDRAEEVEPDQVVALEQSLDRLQVVGWSLDGRYPGPPVVGEAGLSGTSLGEARVDERDDLVVAVEALSVIRNRTDAVHSDGSSDGGGDGHGDTGGDGLNIPES
jgi:hypothetical protein